MSIFSKVGHGISKGIGNVSGGIGGFLNDLLGSSDTMKQTYRYNQQAANADMQRSIYLWNMQNQYNTPAAQIARLSAAGIDVNPMTYAVGNGSMSSTAGSISAPGMGSVSAGSSGANPLSMLMSVVEGIQDMKVKKQTEKNVRTETELNDIKKQIAKKDLEFYNRHGFNPDNHDTVVQAIGTADAANALLEQENKKRYEAYKKGLKGKNVTPLSRKAYDEYVGEHGPKGMF